MTDVVEPVLSSLLACAVASCEANLDDVPARAFISAGQVSWDDCCDGQLWVRLISLVPHRPTQPVNPRVPGAVPFYAASIGVGILRCAATLDDDGSAPTPETLTAEGLRVSADATALLTAIQCCFGQSKIAERRMEVVRFDVAGPDGGCVGGEWLINVLVDNCDC